VAAQVGPAVDEVLRQHSMDALHAGRAALPAAAEDELRRMLMDTFTGLGALQPLIDHPDIENIDVNGFDNVFVTYAGGKRARLAPVASSDEELADMLRKVAASLGAQERRFDMGQPQLDLQLPGGARLFATMVVAKRVCVSIRRHRFMHISLGDLQRLGSISPAMRHLFEAVVAARLNVVISGGMDTGKTTFIRALASVIAESERIITIEDPYELALEAV
jgi:Flp pilus assembly CpaF family ATPase